MEKEEIIARLKNLKTQYDKEGFKILALFGSYSTDKQTKKSDIDILYDVDNVFLERYRGFSSASKVIEIQKEFSKIFHKRVEFTSPSGLSQKLKEEICSKAIYV